MVTTQTKEVFTEKCEICGKEIFSLTERQLKSNMEVHKLTHKNQKERK